MSQLRLPSGFELEYMCIDIDPSVLLEWGRAVELKHVSNIKGEFVF